MHAHSILQLVTSPRGATCSPHVNCRTWSKSNPSPSTDDVDLNVIDTSTICLWMASVAMHPGEIPVLSLVLFTSKNLSSGEFRLHISQSL